MLSVKDELFLLMDCPGFWLLLSNVICSKHRRTGGNYEKSETEKLAKISYQLNESKSKCIITQLTKNLSKVIVKSTRKRFHHCKSNKKIEVRHHFTLKVHFTRRFEAIFGRLKVL